MTIDKALPSKFFDRISKYPDKVQFELSQELDETLLYRHTLLLHGKVSEDSLLPTGLIVDAFLSKLIASKRFFARLSSLFKSIATDDLTNLDEFVDSFLIPVTDPQKPYIHKIREVLEGGVEDRARDLLETLIDLGHVQRAINIYSGSMGEICAQMMIEAARSRKFIALNAILGANNYTIEFREPGKFDRDEDYSKIVRGFAKMVLRTRTDAGAFSEAERLCLNAIAKRETAIGSFLLRSPARLAVKFESPADDNQLRAWELSVSLGIVDHIVVEPEEVKFERGEEQATLHLNAPTSLPLIALAYLKCVNCVPGESIAIVARRTPSAIGWSRQITGFPADHATYHEVGHFAGVVREAEQAEARSHKYEMVFLETTYEALAPATAVNFESAYALIVCLDRQVRTDHYTNIEACLVMDDMASLNATLKSHGPFTLKKPVLFLDKFSPKDENYIIIAVTKFWSLGAKYLVSCLSLTYDTRNGAFDLEVPKRDHITHIAPLTTSALPLSSIIRAAFQDNMMAGVVASSDELLVCYESQMSLVDELKAQKRKLNSSLTPSMKDMICLVGTVNTHSIGRHEITNHWPIENLIVPYLMHEMLLKDEIQDFIHNPSATSAEAIVERLNLSLSDGGDLLAELDNFAVKLSELPEILLSLSDNQIISYLRLSRLTVGADRIAANLAVIAVQICQKGIRNIVPLFELLACCLPRQALLTALAFCTTSAGSASHYLLHIAECIRRYGDENLMIFMISYLKAENPVLLKDRKLLECLQPLLDIKGSPLVGTVAHTDVLQDVGNSLSFEVRFRKAALKGDRDMLLRMSKNVTGLQSVDFLKWMDSLRNISAELRSQQLSPFVLPVKGGLTFRKLAAVIFSDLHTLDELNQNGFLESGSELDAVAKSLLGDWKALNGLIADRFGGAGFAPLTLGGGSISNIYQNAADQLSGLAKISSGPLVSVIVSTFNPDIDLLRLSLESLLGQTWTNIEVFLVDDASLPGISEQIEALTHDMKKVRYIGLEVNRGPYAGRNLAVSMAKGDYIAIQDADDWSHPSRFAAQLEVLQTRPEIQVVTMPHIRIDRDGCVQMECDFTVFGDGPMTSMYRRSLFQEVGEFAEVRSRGDVEMRERIRDYYGGHSLFELKAPTMLCFGDAGTLSHSTMANNIEHLKLFRRNISERWPLANLRRGRVALGAAHKVLVPMTLRSQQHKETETCDLRKN